MAKLSTLILILLVPCLLLTQSVTTKDPEDLSQIIWLPPDAPLDTIDRLNQFLESSFHMAREWIVKAPDQNYLIMGKVFHEAQAVNLYTYLDEMSRKKKDFQELCLDVQGKVDYDLAVKELEKVPGSKDWVILSMRLWMGASSESTGIITPSVMKGSQKDNVRKAFGPSPAEKPGTGYKGELIRRMMKDFKDNEFSSIPNLTLSFDIPEVSKTTLSNLDALGDVMGLTNRLLLFTRDSFPPKITDMARLMYCVRTYFDIKQCYLHVRNDFREGMFRYLTTTATPPTHSTTTKSTTGTPITGTTENMDSTIVDDVSSSEPLSYRLWCMIITWMVTIGMKL